MSAVRILAGALALLAGAGCASSIQVTVPAVSVTAPGTVLRAGAAEVDITPPPGAPLFGYAVLSAAPRANGYRTRLKARALVLEGPKGGRVALVQVELGAVSRLLHQKIAARTATLGLGPDRIVLAATHTHAGPGGFFENAFYNAFGSGTPGFDEEFTEWLVARLAGAVTAAVKTLAPAAAAVETIRIAGVSYNRSPAAWRENVCPDCGGSPPPEVDDRMRLLRVNRVTASGTAPLAAFAVFGVHSTGVSKSTDLYHGDVHGYATRYLANFVHARYPGSAFVGAIANGAEGDVAPMKPDQGFRQAETTARAIGEHAFLAYERAGAHLSPDVDVAHAYRELVLPGAHTAAGDVCDAPMVGVPTLAGAEDGPSALRGKVGIYEGRKKDLPVGCHGTKESALGLAQRFIIGNSVPGPETMPTLAPFGVIALYPAGATEAAAPLLAFATVPGEPTTAVGHAISERVASELGALGTDPIAVIGLANGYVGYFTSTAEYTAQHYEGGSTFYGPLQALLAAEQLEGLAGRVRDELWSRSTGRVPRGDSSRILYYRSNEYHPGFREQFFRQGTDCTEGEARWRALGTDVTGSPGAVTKVTFRWEGLWDGYLCSPPRVAVLCGGVPLTNRWGVPESDDGLRFEVRRHGDDEWHATFFPTESEHGKERCVLAVERTNGAAITSAEFTP